MELYALPRTADCNGGGDSLEFGGAAFQKVGFGPPFFVSLHGRRSESGRKVSERGKGRVPLEDLVRSAAEASGVEVVEIRFHAQGKHSFLRVDIDRAGPRGVDLGDCEAVSRILDRSLEESGLLTDQPYDLQVSSPGLDRPIRSDDDLRRNTGRRVVIEVRTADGRVETIRGVLEGASPEHLLVAPPGAAPVRLERRVVVSAVQDPEPEPVGRFSPDGPISRRRRGIV